MKDSILKISLCASILLLITNCAVKQNKVTVASKKDIPIGDTVVYRADKALRNNFFKDSDSETAWVDSIYKQLTVREKIGQLFMVSAYSNKDTVHVNKIKNLIEEYKIGNLIFFQGGPVRQAKLTNLYQSKAKVPLFIGIDAEWGLAMRLDSTYRNPWNMTLGAIQDLKLIEQLGRHMANESKRIGVHFNFAPVLDINTNPKNPIIGNRSFGEDKVNVSNKAAALMHGVQSQGVFSTGKHFPGHGDTATDSHQALPLVNFSKERIDFVELYPYKKLFEQGLVSVMVGHLNVPSLEPTPNLPSSVSYNVVTELLQNKLGFQGLVITDGLGMKGASNFKGPGELEIAALLAGNDILLCPENAQVAVVKLEEAYTNNVITEERLEHSVKKILHYKYKAGLNHYRPIEMTGIYDALNTSENEALNYKLYEDAITVLKNKRDILPIKDLNQKIAYVKLGDDANSTFVSTLQKYTNITEVRATDLDSLKHKLRKFDMVIISFHKPNKAWEKQDFSPTEMQWLKEMAKRKKVILDIFAKPYSLLSLPDFKGIEGLVVSYQNSEISQVVSAGVLFGALEGKGKLPVSINSFFKVNDGLNTQKLDRQAIMVSEKLDLNPVETSKMNTDMKQKVND